MTDCEELYMMECKYYSFGNCTKKSGYHGSVHLLFGCDGDCNRMKRYKRIKAKDK